MKNKNLYYGIAMVLTIVGFALQIMHVQNASYVLTFALVFGLLIQGWHIRQLDRRLEGFGVQRKEVWTYGVLFLIVGAATMEILHIGPSDSVLRWVLVIGILVQSAHIRNLENKLEEKKQIRVD